MNKFQTIVSRLTESSSLAGLGALAILFGAQPDTVTGTLGPVAQIAGGVLSLLAVFRPEKGSTK